MISLNAWGGAMFEPLAAWLPTCGADVLCVQEVTRTAGLGGATRFADGERALPQRANLFDDIAALLPDHQATFVASDAGPVHDAAGRRHVQDFGIAMFVHERLTVGEQLAEFVHGGFVEHDEWAIADRPRIAQVARIIDRDLQFDDRERTVTVAHLHGLRDPAGKHDTPARRHQAERLAELIERTRRPGDLVVACGDLNLLPDSETFAVLAGIGLVDLVGTADTRTSHYPKPVRHANYLLVSDPEQVRSFQVPATPEVSDHRFLQLEI